MRSTLLLDRQAVHDAVDLPELTKARRSSGFLHRSGESPSRVHSRLTDDLTAMVLVPGLHEGIPAYGVKVHAKNPAAAGEAIRGLILTKWWFTVAHGGSHR